MSKKKNLNDQPVGWALFRVSAPMSIGIFGVLMVGLADAFFLARYGDFALTAVGFIYPVTMTLTSLSIGLSAGTSTVVSQALGRGEEEGKQRTTMHAMLMGLALSSALVTAFFLLSPWLFGTMGASDQVLDAVMAYIPWWCLSFPLLVMAQLLNSVFRAAGRSEVAAITMLAQATLNIALTPLLIFGWGAIPEFGVAGAGMATFIARAAGFAGVVLYAWWTSELCFDVNPAKGIVKTVKRIGRVAAPASLSNAINPGGMAAVTAAVAVVGDAAVAGFGAATRVQSLLFLPMLAMSAGIGPVVGQAWGAEDQSRAQKAVRLTFYACAAYGAVLAAVLLIFAQPIAALVADNEDAAEYGAQYLRLVGLSFFGYGILVTGNAAMNARDRALWSMGLSAARIALIYIPFAWAGVLIFGYTGILGAALLANVLGAFGAIIACRAVGLLGTDTAIIRGPARAARSLTPSD
ncbi:MATE family efflux transporter [Tateyamaria omphalii]|uniref:MATE family efflux transporter n=1 Tax=Tateyamaria omphalii TaxID=299262 RepID=A0A1P8MZF4_9RHOB|nr:MATE family efflux transporter [Tateyamaria omphalii]APX13362.1 MATE family efflux transporter [Tateyamaria omphalii]